MDAQSFEHLIQRLTALPRETEWVEFKENQAEPGEIGRYISGLADAAPCMGNRRPIWCGGCRTGAMLWSAAAPAPGRQEGQRGFGTLAHPDDGAPSPSPFSRGHGGWEDRCRP